MDHRSKLGHALRARKAGRRGGNPVKVGMPPKPTDCAVVLPEGPPPRIDPKQPPPYDVPQMVSWMREVRGGLLAGGFFIERNIDIAVEAFFLREMAQSNDPRSEIMQEQLLTVLTLERKANLLCSILARVIPEGEAPIRRQLGEFRTIRNAVAHNPCWLDAIVDQEGYLRGYKPMINQGRQSVEITKKRLYDWNALVQELITKTEEIANWLIDPQSKRPF